MTAWKIVSIHRVFKLCANNFCNPWALHYTGIRSALYQRLHFSNSFIGQMLPWGKIIGILQEWLFITHQIWDPMTQGHFLLGSHIWYCLLEKKSKCKMFPTFLRNTKWSGKKYDKFENHIMHQWNTSTPWRSLSKSRLFRGDRKVLALLYNGGPWEILFSIINKQSIPLSKNNTIQLYFILRTCG